MAASDCHIAFVSPPLPDDTEPQSSPNHRLKTVRDLEGGVWVVHEAPPPAYDRRRAKVLVFQRAGVIRTVRGFPENWFDLTDAELMRMSER